MQRFWMLAVLVLLLLAPNAAAVPPVLAVGNTISGVVQLNTSTPSGIAGAVVLARRTEASAVTITTTTTLDGSYTLAPVPEGTYELSVRPPVPTETSPTWVAAAEPILVSVPPDQPATNLLVEPATVTFTGRLQAPGALPFTGANMAWVRAENQEGRGNTVQVSANGEFTLHVLAGMTFLRFSFNNTDWVAPIELSGRVYFTTEGDTVAVEPNPLLVIEQQAQLSGLVQIVQANGNPVPAPAGIPVRAWRADGTAFAMAVTDQNGAYAMDVISGTWFIRAVPLPDTRYPLNVPPDQRNYYIPAQSPQLALILSDTAVLSTVNLLIATADVTITGSVIDTATGVVPDLDGRAYALYAQNARPTFGSTAPILNGQFDALRLSSALAQTYTVGVAFPPDEAATGLSRVLLSNLQPGETRMITLPVALDTSHITGTLRLRNGTLALNRPGVVWAASNTGGWARTKVNPLSATYDLNVATTDTTGQGGSIWRVRAFVDPTTGVIVQRPRVQRVLVPYNSGNGATVPNIDFTIVQGSELGVITGRVVAPPISAGGQPIPLPGVRIAVRELTEESAAAFTAWRFTDRDGRFRIPVPAGTYRVIAGEGRAFNLPIRNLVMPTPQIVSVTAGSAQNVNLAFRAVNVRLTGTVTLNGTGHPALLRIRAADGSVVHGRTDATGAYTVGLISRLAWTFEAVGSDGNVFLRSDPATVTPNAPPPFQNGPNLVLLPVETIPDTQAFRFSADTDQIFTMSDGAQVEVLAGAMADDSRQIMLTVQPLPELAGDGDTRPVRFGYRLNAFDETSRRPITHFLRPVTLKIPFTATQLASLGITPDQLIPSYWDEASASWKPVETAAVTVDANGDGVVCMGVDHFTDFAVVAAPGGRVFLPITVK